MLTSWETIVDPKIKGSEVNINLRLINRCDFITLERLKSLTLLANFRYFNKNTLNKFYSKRPALAGLM